MRNIASSMLVLFKMTQSTRIDQENQHILLQYYILKFVQTSDIIIDPVKLLEFSYMCSMKVFKVIHVVVV